MQELFDRYEKILSGEISEIELPDSKKFNTYAVTNFRGGIGKTTLSFNLAYAMCQKYMTLFLDVCPQQNFTTLFWDNKQPFEGVTIHDALMGKMMGDAWDVDPEKLALRVQDSNREFQNGKTCYYIPGSSKLFLYPSQFYSRLNEYYGMTTQGGNRKAVSVVLNMLKDIISQQIEITKTEKVLIDTSPFFAGGTHLAWAASEALIIPVRVDEQSIYSLELTLQMLKEDGSDFNLWRERAGIEEKPVVQAILMTHCGWNRQADHQIDKASRMYIERAMEIAEKYSDVFSTNNIVNHVALLSDFHSSGRISGSKAIPIDKLSEGSQYRIEGKKVEVNRSVRRYKKELEYAFKLIDQ